jgi:alpha-1,6-mannosyltransferase
MLDRKEKIGLTLGTLIRMIFSFWTGNPDDFETFIRVGYHSTFGISPTYNKLPYIMGLGGKTYEYVSGLGYSAGWGVLLSFAYRIYKYVPFSPFIYYFLIKSYLIIFDILCIFLLYKIYNYINPNESIKVATMLYLSPVFIIISSIWGMFDTLPLFTILLSIYLLYKERYILSIVSISIGIYFKILPIIYVPLILIYLYKNNKLKLSFFCSIITILLPISLIFLNEKIFNWSSNVTITTIMSQTSRIGGSLSYFNFINLVISQNNYNLFYGFPLIRYFWIFGLIFSYLYLLNKDNVEMKDMVQAYLITTTCFLLTRTFVSEQYIIYLITFLLLNGMTYKSIIINILTSVFIYINYLPFSFFYLLNIGFWEKYLLSIHNPTFSLLRKILLVIIALGVDAYLLILLNSFFIERKKI